MSGCTHVQALSSYCPDVLDLRSILSAGFYTGSGDKFSSENNLVCVSPGLHPDTLSCCLGHPDLSLCSYIDSKSGSACFTYFLPLICKQHWLWVVLFIFFFLILWFLENVYHFLQLPTSYSSFVPENKYYFFQDTFSVCVLPECNRELQI